MSSISLTKDIKNSVAAIVAAAQTKPTILGDC